MVADSKTFLTVTGALAATTGADISTQMGSFKNLFFGQRDFFIDE